HKLANQEGKILLALSDLKEGQIQSLRTAAKLYKIPENLLDRQSHTPPSPTKTVVDQLIKGSYLSLHSTALLTQENANLHTANEKKRQKRNRSHRQIPHKGGLSVEEGLLLVEQLVQEEKANRVVLHTLGELPIQTDPPRTRAPPRYIKLIRVG
ncbi:hypothetical protein N7533_008520, partial [Penicillium manginii]|uniref:uncharacterized protein n=1 Tax=Penicillium manginii TaxID=203109 RepID=UPI0025491505